MADDQCPAPDCGPGPAVGETGTTGTRLIREQVVTETYGVAKGSQVTSAPQNGCERTLLTVLMFCMSEGAGPRSHEPEDTPNARVAE